MKIICAARNYLEHAKELGNDVPDQPIYFMKADSCIWSSDRPFYLPDFSKDIQYEAELVIKINRLGKNIDEKFAHRYYDEVGLGIDLTARDVQAECVKNGWPWEKAKAFDGSAILGKFISLADKDIKNIQFQLFCNGKKRQDGNTQNMIFGVDQFISYISKYMTLKIGDLIFTGTPEGVGQMQIGDQLTGVLEGEKLIDLKVK